jgi:hypothetical protein
MNRSLLGPWLMSMRMKAAAAAQDDARRTRRGLALRLAGESSPRSPP